MHDEMSCTCGCRKQLAVRLCEAFKPLAWHDDRWLDFDEASQWLEVTREDVEVLVNTGLLKATPDDRQSWVERRVELADLVAFIAESDWLRRRAELHLAHLQERVTWLNSRRKEAEAA